VRAAPPGDSSTRLGRVALLAASTVVILGALVRLYRLDFDLPQVVEVDAFKFVGEAARMARERSFRPHDFQYPGFYANQLALIYRACGAETIYAQHTIARAISASFGIAGIVLTWVLARLVTGPIGSLVAAALAASSIVCVTSARMTAADSIVAFFVTGGLCCLVRRRVSLWRYLLAGVLAGLAAGSKYNGVVLLPFVLLTAAVDAVEMRTYVRPLAGALLAIVVAVAVFWITTPWFITLVDDYWRRFVIEARIQQYGQVGHVQLGYADYLISATPTPEQPWLRTSIVYDVGPIALAAIMAGLALGLAGRGGWGVFLLSLFAVSYLVLISGPGRVKAVRFLMPILPALFVVTGWLVEFWLVRPLGRYRAWAGAAALVALVAMPAYQSVRHVLTFRQPSTNSLLRSWANENIPPGSKVFVSPFFTDDLAPLPLQFVTIPNVGARLYRLPEGVGLSAERESIYSYELFEEMRAAGVEYIVMNSYFNDAFSRTSENLRWFPRSVKGYSGFFFIGFHVYNPEPVFEVFGQSAGRPGPDIQVHRLIPNRM